MYCPSVDLRDAGELTLSSTPVGLSDKERAHLESKKLGQITGTCIAGNDLLGSVFYTIGVCTATTGVFSPISLGCVALALVFFRPIYSEIGLLLPKNGGTYQCLLNSTVPFPAVIAGICSILSYIATCVVSASTFASYAESAAPEYLDVFWLTIVAILVVMCLNLCGLKESAFLATAIFMAHAITLIILMSFCIKYIVEEIGATQLNDNYNQYMAGKDNPTIAYNWYLGYCVGMLGITGFETSSNYIEDQKRDTFPKTIRNMCILYTLYTPGLALLTICTTPLSIFQSHPESVLAETALIVGGYWLNTLIVVDACVVLIGGVLTAFVGVSGIVERMVHDRYLPHFLSHKMQCTNVSDRIIVGFAILCILLYLMVAGNQTILGGMFAISFLTVMTMFLIGNVALKLYRTRMPRKISASWLFLFGGLIASVAAILGNILQNPVIIVHFFVFFAIISVLIVCTVYRKSMNTIGQKRCPGVWKLCNSRAAQPIADDKAEEPDESRLGGIDLSQLRALDNSEASLTIRERVPLRHALTETFDEPLTNEQPNILRTIGFQRDRQPMIFLLSCPNVRAIGNALYYCEFHAGARALYLVHFCDHPQSGSNANAPCGVKKMWQMMRSPFQHLHPKLKIRLVIVNASFNPENLREVCNVLEVKHNFVFLRAPGPNWKYYLGDFGEMRIII